MVCGITISFYQGAVLRKSQTALIIYLKSRADGKYGNHSFLGPLKEEPCGVLARMRCDRVLYQDPGEYSGRGRPRVHGDRFAFKEPETWREPQETVNDDESGLHHDYEVWLEELAPHAPIDLYWHNRTGEATPTRT